MQMSLQIIGAGFGRTSTHSLKLAIEALGFGPCYHLFEIRDNSALLSPWEEAMRGNLPDWDVTFQGYNSQVDWPGAYYWKELHRAYPEAKVILTVRDPDAWYSSLQATIVKSITIGREADPDPHKRAVADMVYQTIHQGLFSGDMVSKDHVLKIYHNHIEEVQDTVPAAQLLTYEVADGWKPLCEFLGVDKPTTDFPRSNTRSEFIKNKSFLNDPRI
jgi:hypothetical protein